MTARVGGLGASGRRGTAQRASPSTGIGRLRSPEGRSVIIAAGPRARSGLRGGCWTGDKGYPEIRVPGQPGTARADSESGADRGLESHTAKVDLRTGEVGAQVPVGPVPSEFA